MAHEQRRLAAIVSADVVGYSRLMGRDESGTLAALKTLRREVIDPPIAAHGGRIVKTTGDGLLLEFGSVVAAVRCVIAVQQAMATHNGSVPEANRIEFRVGVNIGDIIVEGDDIFGDGVNVAARLQEIASPGGVCLSGRVQEDVRGKLDIALEDAGERQLKNIAWPVRVWHVRELGASISAPTASPTSEPTKTAAGERSARPTLAVLPFDNMGGEATLESFCDGLAEDLITNLSGLRWIHVVSRKSSFAYKGRSHDVREVARGLGATYVLEGSVRQVGNRVRINAQLINARSGNHAWARRYDRDFVEPFELQDEIIGNILGCLHYVLWYGMVRGDDGSGPPDPEASPLRAAAWHMTQNTAADIDLVVAYARRALEINPRSVAAYQYLVLGCASRLMVGWSLRAPDDATTAVDAARRAVALSPADALSQGLYATSLAWMRDRTGSLAAAQRSLSLDAKAAQTLGPIACAWTIAGDAREANDLIGRLLDFSPAHYGRSTFLSFLALNWHRLGAPDRGLLPSEEAIQLKPELIVAHVSRAAVLAAVGRIDDARAALTAAKEQRPDLDRAIVDAMLPYSDPADTARLMAALIEAGLNDSKE